VGGEHSSGSHHLQRFTEVQAVTDEVADPLHPEKARVTLVGMEHLGSRCTGELVVDLDRTHATDSEEQFLQESVRGR
jgi:hypothetical protein